MNDLSSMIDDLIHEAAVAALPEWTGAPLTFTTDFYTSAETAAAWERWVFINGHFGSAVHSNMWHHCHWGVDGTGRDQIYGVDLHGHTVSEWTVDLRCRNHSHGKHHLNYDMLPSKTACSDVGEMLTKIICDTCRTHFIGSETDAILAMHDHIFPGWRDLPIFPEKLRVKMGPTIKMTEKIQDWLEQNYPPEFITTGAPTIRPKTDTGRGAVPHYNVFGGYDIRL